MPDGTLLSILAIGLIVATVRDLQIREVPDLVSAGLLATGLIGSAILSGNLLVATSLCALIILVLYLDSSWIAAIAKRLTKRPHLEPLLEIVIAFAIVLSGIALAAYLAPTPSILGLLAATAMGGFMLATRQWGGGDAKLLMGVGSILGLSEFTFLWYAALLILSGALWGIAYTIFLAIRHRDRFAPEWKRVIRRKAVHRLRIALVVTGVILLAGMLFTRGLERILIGLLLAGTYLIFYSWLFIRAIERGVMLKDYPIAKLTEGDWIAQDIHIDGKLFISEKNTGVTIEQIERLKRSRIRTVKVREGIPFVPSFLIAFAILMLL